MSVKNNLSELIERLYRETEGYAENPSDAQLWYNRGYANGVVAFFKAQGFQKDLPSIVLDAENLYKNDGVMEWFKAYHHGYEMGERESAEVYELHG